MAKILVLDDNEILLNTVSDALRNEGYEVFSTNDSADIEKTLSEQNYNLLITDIIMPDREGIEIIIHSREYYPDMKILAISGKDLGGFNVLEVASGIGADDTLKKPFTNSQLIEKVKAVLG